MFLKKKSMKGNVRGSVCEGGTFSPLTGTTTLNVDFATQKMTGSFDNLHRPDGTVYASSASVDANFGSSNHITGTLSAPGMSGNIDASFFGPKAQEVGGSWTLNKDDGSAKAGGTFAAKQK